MNLFKTTFGWLLAFDLKFKGNQKQAPFKIEVQITQNKILEVLNSRLLRSYAMLDARFRKLALVLKAWNKTLSNDKNGRFNSFTICLLLLGFMLHKEFLPNL
jgi:DNA polymerase sigma